MISRSEAKQRWRGVVIPLVTPFRSNGELDLDALQANVQWLVDQGATTGNSVFLTAGSGGDFTSMNLDERKLVISATAKIVGKTAPILAGVQSLDIREVIDLCQHCEYLGIDGVQISGPYYYDGKPEDTVAWFEEVARHTNIGFAVYNNWYTGYDMPLDLIERLLELQSTVAVKWSSPDIEIFLAGVRQFSPHVAIVDNGFVPVLGHMSGCDAFVSHWPNFEPAFPWRIWELLEAGDYAKAFEEYEHVMVPYSEVVSQVAADTVGEGVFVRPLMKIAGRTGGYSRLPSRDEAVSPEIAESFERVLSDARAMLRKE